MLLLKISLPENCLAAEIHRGERRLPRLPLAGFLKWPIYKKTSGRRHRGPVRAPGFVCLSALEQLFRQLVSSRTVQLSSYQLPGPPRPPTSTLCLLLRLCFVRWPVSWRLSDGREYRFDKSRAWWMPSIRGDRCAAPPVSQSHRNSAFCCVFMHFWMLLWCSLKGGRGSERKLSELLICARYRLSRTADCSCDTHPVTNKVAARILIKNMPLKHSGNSTEWRDSLLVRIITVWL